MLSSICICVEEPTQIAEARRLARARAEAIGFDETRAEEVAIVVTEAAGNILKHAGRGELLINTVPAEDGQTDAALEVFALDRGPGMDDLEKCTQDGYSTANTPGHGLGAIRRLSTFADFYSRPGKGTAMVARWETPGAHAREPRLQAGSLNLPKPGQIVCGDAWGIVRHNGCTTVMVADGLGHGYEASLASHDAVRILRERSTLPPQAILEAAHAALRSSRGAAVAVARIEPGNATIGYCGVGNISAQIHSASGSVRQHLVSMNGTLGHQASHFREFSYPWPDDGLLIMHSDGLLSATGLEAHPGLAQRDPGLIAGMLYRDYSRGNDDATVVVVKQ